MSAAVTGVPAAAADQALWRNLTTATSPTAFGEAWLGLTGRSIARARAGTLALVSGPDEEPAICHWPAGTTASPGLLAAAHAVLRGGQGTVQPDVDGRGGARIAYPVRVSDKLVAACAFDLDAAADRDPRLVMRQVQWAAAWLRDWRRERDAEAAERALARAALALDLLAAVLDERRFVAACRICATELATRFDCERVAIGFSSRMRARIAAISHTARFGRSMDLVRLLADAMDEAIDQRGPVICPPPSEDTVMITRAHAALAAAHGTGHIFTVPMFARDRFVGAVTFERAADRPFTQADIDVADSVVAILGPALLDKRDVDKSLAAKAADTIADQAVHLFGPGYWGRKVGVAAAAAVVVFGCFARGPYRIHAEARVEGTVQRALATPFDGFIAEAAVKAGETVRSGQVLAVLDDRDLVLERLRWVTERQQHLAEYDQALSLGKRADAARFKAQIDEAAAQTRLIDEQLGRTRITAPFDGIVVSGDLSQSIGGPSRRGDVLFEIAPLDSYRVVLRVHESQIADVTARQTGTLLVSALPDVALRLTVLRIVPVAEAREGRTVFQVDASLDATTPRLRPGMEGVGKIDAGRRRLVWIWFRSLAHWLRVESWAWLA